jgi:hypothetical protein
MRRTKDINDRINLHGSFRPPRMKVHAPPRRPRSGVILLPDRTSDMNCLVAVIASQIHVPTLEFTKLVRRIGGTLDRNTQHVRRSIVFATQSTFELLMFAQCPCPRILVVGTTNAPIRKVMNGLFANVRQQRQMRILSFFLVGMRHTLVRPVHRTSVQTPRNRIMTTEGKTT